LGHIPLVYLVLYFLNLKERPFFQIGSKGLRIQPHGIMRHNSPFSFRTRLAAELRLAYPAYSYRCCGGVQCQACVQSLDVTCGDEFHELTNEAVNEVAIANSWRIYDGG
jgi:hypothetical protein